MNIRPFISVALELESLRDQLARAFKTTGKLEEESGVYREAYRAGGDLGPDEFYKRLGMARSEVVDLEKAIRKLTESERSEW